MKTILNSLKAILNEIFKYLLFSTLIILSIWLFNSYKHGEINFWNKTNSKL